MHLAIRTFTQNHLRAFFLCVFSTLFFSAMGAVGTYLSKTIPVGEIAFFRVFISLVFLLPYLLIRKISFFGNRKKLVFLRAVVGFSALVCGFFSLSKIPMAEVSILWKSSVLFTALLSVVILKEKITKGLALCILVAFIGALLVIKPSMGFVNIGGFSALLSAFLVSIVGISIRTLHKTEHSDTIVFGFSFWGTCLGLIFFAPYFVLPNRSEFLMLISVGILGLIGQMSFTRAFLYAKASVIQPLMFFEIIFSTILGMIFFNQVPDLFSIFGGIAIIISGIGIIRLSHKD